MNWLSVRWLTWSLSAKADIIREELEAEFRQDKFFTGSKVVLCFIGNETKRFYNYIRSCVGRLRNQLSPDKEIRNLKIATKSQFLVPEEDALRTVIREVQIY